MEKLTILELIDFLRKNWKYIHTLEESKVEHFFLQRSPIELLLFASQVEFESNYCYVSTAKTAREDLSDPIIAFQRTL